MVKIKGKICQPLLELHSKIRTGLRLFHFCIILESENLNQTTPNSYGKIMQISLGNYSKPLQFSTMFHVCGPFHGLLIKVFACTDTILFKNTLVYPLHHLIGLTNLCIAAFKIQTHTSGRGALDASSIHAPKDVTTLCAQWIYFILFSHETYCYKPISL